MRSSCNGLVEYIAGRYDSVAEIGVGHFPDMALALSNRGVRVFATDIKQFAHERLKVIVDDITRPDLSVYSATDLLYSLRPPPELVPYMNQLARRLSIDLIVKPLASEHLGGRLTRCGSTTFFLWNFL